MKLKDLVGYSALYLMDPPPKFCWECGKNIELFRLEGGYNMYTGEKKHHFVLMCPSKIDDYNHLAYLIKEERADLPPVSELPSK